jgi:hypothetical protein
MDGTVANFIADLEDALHRTGLDDIWRKGKYASIGKAVGESFLAEAKEEFVRLHETNFYQN